MRASYRSEQRHKTGVIVYAVKTAGTSLISTRETSPGGKTTWSSCSLPPGTVSPFRKAIGSNKWGTVVSGNLSNVDRSQIIDCLAGVDTVVRELDQPVPEIVIASDAKLMLVSQTNSNTDMAVVRAAT